MKSEQTKKVQQLINLGNAYQKGLQDFFGTEHSVMVHTWIKPVKFLQDLTEREAVEMIHLLDESSVAVSSITKFGKENISAALSGDLTIFFDYKTERERKRVELQKQLAAIQEQLATL